MKWNVQVTSVVSASTARPVARPLYPLPAPAVSLAGWAVRDSHLRGDKHQPGYKFPSSAIIQPGGSIVVNVGRGTNAADRFYCARGGKQASFTPVNSAGARTPARVPVGASGTWVRRRPSG